MTPVTPTVQRVSPRCYQCGGSSEVVRGDGRFLCKSCIRIAVRLATLFPTTDPPSIHDDDVREGWRK